MICGRNCVISELRVQWLVVIYGNYRYDLHYEKELKNKKSKFRNDQMFAVIISLSGNWCSYPGLDKLRFDKIMERNVSKCVRERKKNKKGKE